MLFELIGDLIGILIYPGGLALGVGLIPELLLRWNRRRLTLGRSIPPAISAAILTAMLAASQLDIPFNPVPSSQRSYWLAGIALVGGSWLISRRPTFWRRLGVPGAWLITLLALIVEQNTFHPPGSGLAGVFDPVRIGVTLVYMLSLPTLLGLLEEDSREGVRLWLWWPYCGLLAALLLPSTHSLAGLGIFLLFSAGIAGLAIGEAWLLIRSKLAQRIVEAAVVV
ncbi:MAG: hypothetical protein ACREP9_11180, partial [Candidatus Dormibacteraceae bacterium]